jgi:hypothetical protein
MHHGTAASTSAPALTLSLLPTLNSRSDGPFSGGAFNFRYLAGCERGKSTHVRRTESRCTVAILLPFVSHFCYLF